MSDTLSCTTCLVGKYSYEHLFQMHVYLRAYHYRQINTFRMRACTFGKRDTWQIGNSYLTVTNMFALMISGPSRFFFSLLHVDRTLVL